MNLLECMHYSYLNFKFASSPVCPVWYTCLQLQSKEVQRSSCGLVCEECSVSKVPLAIKIEWKVRTALSKTFYILKFYISTYCPRPSVHLSSCGTSSINVEIRLLHSQPFMNSHFHFLTIVEFAKIGQMHQCVQGLCWKNDASVE